MKREGEKFKKTLDKIIAKHNKLCAWAQKTFKKKKQLHKHNKKFVKRNRVFKEKCLQDKNTHQAPYIPRILAKATGHA